MKPLFILSLVIVIAGKTTVSVAQKQATLFDTNNGILTLPEVSVIPNDCTFAAKLRQIEGDEFILELDTLTPINTSSNYYNSTNGQLYLPTVIVDTKTFQKIELELITPPTNPPRFRLVAVEVDKTAIRNVLATVETEPVPASGDAADDPAIWIHPLDPAKSTIIGTQKQGGLGVYDLAGKEIQYLADGNMNNVDLRYGFSLGGEKITIVAASNRSNDSIALYKINPDSRQLENIAAGILQVRIKNIYGFCMYHSALSGLYYVFINNKNGAVEQWQLFETENKLVDASFVRRFQVNSQVEGCVADDVLGHFYLGEERVGIWKFSAEPEGGHDGYLIDTTKKGGYLTPEVEGLTLYYANETQGYLIASNQGNNSFTVYNRAGDNEYLGKFQITANDALNIDQVDDTDGIDVINVPLGDAFPYGVFVAQDGENIDPEENQNFKLVPWENIANVLELKKETSYNPSLKFEK